LKSINSMKKQILEIWLLLNKQTSLCKKLYDFIYFSYFAITF